MVGLNTMKKMPSYHVNIGVKFPFFENKHLQMYRAFSEFSC